MLEIEAFITADTTPTAYTPFRLMFNETPAFYGKTYAYVKEMPLKSQEGSRKPKVIQISLYSKKTSSLTIMERFHLFAKYMLPSGTFKIGTKPFLEKLDKKLSI